MRMLRIAFLAVVALVFGLSIVAVLSSTAVPTPMAGATVLVKLPMGHGSGVHIGNGYIVTAAHVVKGESDIIVKADDGRTFKPEVMWVNEKYDLALLKITADGVAARKLFCGAVGAGVPVWSLGNPLGLAFVAFRGYVSGPVRDLGDWPEALVLDVTIAPGMSGGPLMDEKGNVVGIVVGTSRSYPIGVAVPSATVCRLMGRVA